MSPGPRTRRLVLVTNDSAFFQSHRRPVADAARAAGWDVHVATPPGVAVEAIGAAGFEHHPIPLSRRGMGPSESRTLIALLRLYRRLRPNVVHHFTMKPVVYGGIAARGAGVPASVATITGLGYAFLAGGPRGSALRRVATTGYRAALSHPRNGIFFQNADDEALFRDLDLLGRVARIARVPGSGVDVHSIVPSPPPADPPVVALIGRLLRDKGVLEFIEAARRLRARGSLARFVLVGAPDPENPSSLSQLEIKSVVAEGAVEIWGWRHDMDAVYRAASIVCLPSYREGVPRSLLEASAHARPLVTTDAPGCRELVRDGINGLRVPVRDAGAIADALAALLADSGLRGKLGAEARRIVEREYDARIVGTRAVEMYEHLLEAPR